MSLTVRIVWQYILSRVHVSVQSSIFFIREKLQKPLWNRVASTYVNEWPATGIVWPASKRGRPTMTESWLGALTLRTETVVGGGRGVRVREYERVYARACMHACVRDVFAIYDNDILPMLIIIIINIIILYFIQIRHTDDFPSTGTGLVNRNKWKCAKKYIG